MKIQNAVEGLYTQDVQAIKDAQAILAKCQNEIHKRVKRLSKEVETYIQKEWDKTFPGLKVHFLTGFEGGCMTDKWVEHVFFYSVEDKDLHESGFYETYADDLPRGKVRKVVPPITKRKLRSFCKRIDQELGVKCKLCNSTYVTNCLKGLYDNDDWGENNE